MYVPPAARALYSSCSTAYQLLEASLNSLPCGAALCCRCVITETRTLHPTTVRLVLDGRKAS